MKIGSMKKTNKWETESSAIDKEDIEHILFTNEVIDSFLCYENNYFIIANKGLGKTLMLQYKRLLLEKEYKGSAKFIPNDNPYLDNMDSIGNLDKQKINLFSNIEECKSIWSLSLELSILSFHTNNMTSKELKELLKISNILEITLENILSTNILLHLLSMTYSQLKKFTNTYRSQINSLFRQTIKSKTFIFIDRLDQALYDNKHFYEKEVFRKLWINFQAGLMLGAWEVMQKNNHVKIYTSIRHEALANTTDYSQDKSAISSSTTQVKYSNKELYKMLNQLSYKYENKETFEAFIGFDKIDNVYHNKEEDIFNYIRRHTLGRPRDFVRICHGLSLLDEITIERYRTHVNNESSDIVESYFSEQSPFLKILDNKEERNVFLSLLNSNILNADELTTSCDSFNRNGCDKNCKNCNYSHPFCELYNIGLLGILEEDAINGKYIQTFLRPSEIRINIDKSLPKSRLYIVHPALEQIITRAKNDLNFDKPYKIVRNFIVGHKLEWNEDDIKKIEASKVMQELNITDVDDIEKLIYEHINSKKDDTQTGTFQDFIVKVQEKMLTKTTNEVASQAIEALKQIFM